MPEGKTYKEVAVEALRQLAESEDDHVRLLSLYEEEVRLGIIKAPA